MMDVHVLKRKGEPEVKQLTRSTFLSSNAQDITEWTDKRADRQYRIMLLGGGQG
jgi:hypothetical protein